MATGDNRLSITNMNKHDAKLYKSANSYAAALIAALNAEKADEVVPEGWFTTVQIAGILGCSRPRAAVKIRDASMERRNFRIMSGQVFRPVPHYRLPVKKK